PTPPPACTPATALPALLRDAPTPTQQEGYGGGHGGGGARLGDRDAGEGVRRVEGAARRAVGDLHRVHPQRVGVDPPALKVDPRVGRFVPDEEGLGETGAGKVLRRGREDPEGDVLADPVGEQYSKGVEVAFRVTGDGDGLADVVRGEAEVLKEPRVAAAVVLNGITDGRDDAVLLPALAAAEREQGLRKSGGRPGQ